MNNNTPQVNQIKGVVVDLVGKMGFTNVSCKENIEREDRVVLNIDCEQKGLLIGHDGVTLDALQYIANIICNKNISPDYKIIIDVGEYRSKKQAEMLKEVEEIIQEVKLTGKTIKISQINSFDRREIHLLVSKHDELESYSEGEGNVKDIFIGPKNQVAE